MSTKPPPVTPRTMKIVSIVILAFSAALILFGLNMFQLGIKDAKTAQGLQVSGMAGTVVDARTQVVRADDGELHALRVELTFVDADGGNHTLNTNHFPQYHPPLDSPQGYVDDFPTKDQIVGQPVTYRLGESPEVELTNNLSAIANEGWGFPNYLGIALMVMGSGAAIGGVVSLIRATRRTRRG
jgi:hypothetical protein